MFRVTDIYTATFKHTAMDAQLYACLLGHAGGINWRGGTVD